MHSSNSFQHFDKHPRRKIKPTNDHNPNNNETTTTTTNNNDTNDHTNQLYYTFDNTNHPILSNIWITIPGEK